MSTRVKEENRYDLHWGESSLPPSSSSVILGCATVVAAAAIPGSVPKLSSPSAVVLTIISSSNSCSAAASAAAASSLESAPCELARDDAPDCNLDDFDDFDDAAADDDDEVLDRFSPDLVAPPSNFAEEESPSSRSLVVGVSS